MSKRLQVTDDAGLHGSSLWLFLGGAAIILLIMGATILLVVTLRLLRGKQGKEYTVISSSELKAQVSFSDRLSKSFSHFHLFLQSNKTTISNQTWQKASLGKGNSSLFK